MPTNLDTTTMTATEGTCILHCDGTNVIWMENK